MIQEKLGEMATNAANVVGNTIRNKLTDAQLSDASALFGKARAELKRKGFDILRDANGKFVYVPHGKETFSQRHARRKEERAHKKEYKNFIKGKTKDGLNTISDIKSDLSQANADKQAIIHQMFGNRMKGVTSDVEANGAKYHMKKLNKRIDEDTNKLGSRGIGVYIPSPNSKNKNIRYSEGVENTMLTTSTIDRMENDIFMESENNQISDNFRDYMYAYLEQVRYTLERDEALSEIVMEELNNRRNVMCEAVEDRFYNGDISRREAQYLLEQADDMSSYDIVYPEDIPAIVNAYLEASRYDDEDTMMRLSSLLESANYIKDRMDELGYYTEAEDDDTDSDSADDDDSSSDDDDPFSIADKLDELKITLTDKEKELIEKIDEDIKKAYEKNKKGDKDDSDDSDDDDSSSDDSGDDDSDDDDSSSKSTSESVKEIFESVEIDNEPNYAMTDKMVDYLKESVYDGTYDLEDARRVLEMIDIYES